ncbi:MAG: hypothetical protein AUJ70_04900 [Candidatus Omnitrophica bacterium CG1_02_40_15]|nr:MAG: hypothetical protein AUJ70_04900 [Candidatus Omnitrophica bacterium CG1_02_40_15]
MKKILAYLIIGLLIAIPVYAYVGYKETKTAVMTMTIAPLFSVSVSLNTLDFGNVQPGLWKELKTAGGGYHNEVVCKSNDGEIWHLKIKIDHALTSESKTIPLANLKWMCAYVGSKNSPYAAGTGTLANAIDYISFTTADALVYTCGADEKNNLPNGIGAQFNYGLSVPDTQSAGNYTAIVTYTMTETL